MAHETAWILTAFVGVQAVALQAVSLAELVVVRYLDKLSFNIRESLMAFCAFCPGASCVGIRGHGPLRENPVAGHAVALPNNVVGNGATCGGVGCIFLGGLVF